MNGDDSERDGSVTCGECIWWRALDPEPRPVSQGMCWDGNTPHYAVAASAPACGHFVRGAKFISESTEEGGEDEHMV